MGVETTFVDTCDLAAFEEAIAEAKPGAVIMETISNPLLRVGALDKIAEHVHEGQRATDRRQHFATPLLMRPLELGANIVVHSATKYLAGHGDVLGGVLIADQENFNVARTISRTLGPIMGPFEAYLTMRGIKTLALRVERQCANACKVASWLAAHPGVERVYFTGDPKHPDAATIARLLPERSVRRHDLVRIERRRTRRSLPLHGKAEDDRARHLARRRAHHDALPGHGLASRSLAQASPAPGIRDNLVRISVGIEASEDIIADLEQALRAVSVLFSNFMFVTRHHHHHDHAHKGHAAARRAHA